MSRPKFSLAFSLLCLVLVLLGVFFRLAYLNQKVFWNDEVYSSVPVLGHTVEGITTEWQQRSSQGFVTVANALERYQSLAPDTSVGTTIQSLAHEEPQNSPLYFVLSRFWLEITGGGPMAMRGLAAMISLLALPLMYGLAQELFQAEAIATLAVSLTAVSPMQILYAQEARQYSLLILATLLSSLALLRALRLKTWPHWLLYGLSLAMGMYAQPFFGFVAIAHTVYILFLEPFSFKEGIPALRGRLWPFMGASSLGLLLYFPWLWMIVTGLDRISPWRGRTELPWFQLAGRWLLNLTRTFFDASWGRQNLYNLRVHPLNPTLYLALFFGFLVGYSFYYLITHTERRIWLFVVTLTVFPAIFLVGADLLLGGVRSTIPRYILPAYLGVLLGIAFLLGQGILGGGMGRLVRPRFWAPLTAFVLTMGCLSCALLLPGQTWWSKYSNYYDPELATIINASPRSVVISESALRLISMGYLLRSETILHLGDDTAPIDIERFSDNRDIYIYDARASATRLKEQIEASTNRQFEQVFSQPFEFIDGSMQLWKLPHSAP